MTSIAAPHEAKPIAITMGDAAGIGPEIIAKAFVTEPVFMRQCVVAGEDRKSVV